MKLYKEIKRVSDLKSASDINGSMNVLLAHLRKNYITSLSNINQKKIVSTAQELYKDSGKDVPIILNFKDNSTTRLMLKNGQIGPVGRIGKTGAQGDKGDSFLTNINPSYDEAKGVKDWLTIANDCLTNDDKAVLSALQGYQIKEALDKMTETFLSDYQYALLFTNHVTIDTEFETYEDNQLVQLICEDPASHKRYCKYWTFESEGDQEYFIFNYQTATYDSVYADIWTDIYMGGKTGYFDATTNQLSDGTQLYVKDDKTNTYKAIDQFNDIIYIQTPEGYLASSLKEGEGPWFIQRMVKNDTGEYEARFIEVDSEYVNKNKEKSYLQRDFVYYLKNADCDVVVNYTRENGYDYNLRANELPENIYRFDYKDADGVNHYIKISFDEVDPSSIEAFYKKVGDSYEMITNIAEYIEKKADRYYKYGEGVWVEVESFENINTDNWEDYIHVNYDKYTNTNTFTHYTHIHTVRGEDYYDVKEGVLNNYSIKYYTLNTPEEPRRYFTCRITTSEDETGNAVFHYEYKEITIPFWLECEFITAEEDQNVRLLSNNPTDKETTDVDVVDPIYISSIEFEDSEIVIAKNYNKDIKVHIYPENANVTNMILDYDDSLINIYEDGRIAALTNDDITKETKIKLYVENDETIGDEVNVKIVTPVDSISLGTDEINLYPGTSFDLNPVIYPNEVTDAGLKYTISDPEMLTISADGTKISPKRQSDGSYKMGTCKLTVEANDGFGAKLEIPVLVAIPITNITIKSKSFAFIGREFEIETQVLPVDATLIILNYESSDESILKISKNGLITPLKEGTVNVTCSSTDGSGVKAVQEIRVTTGVDEITIDNFDDSLEVGLTNNIQITVLPENATDKSISVFASDESTIEYTQPVLRAGTTNVYDMEVTAIKGGSTQFIVRANDGTETVGTHDLIVPIPIERISFEEPEIVIYEGDDIKLIRPIVTGPESAAANSLDWHSSNTISVTVDNNGRITPVKAGKAKISAISKDDNKVIGSCNVIVKKHTESIVINNGNTDTIEILKNNYGFIQAYVTPNDASDQILNWTSQHPEIVTVDANGVIYGIKEGESIITAAAKDKSDLAVSITVKVK